MYLHFDTCARHQITEANANFYATPFRHPSRTMNTHDFIYMIDGEWSFWQNDKEYALKNDSLLILSANHRHDGMSACRAGTKTMYFHASLAPGDRADAAEDDACDTLRTLTDAAQNRHIKKAFWNVVNAKMAGHEDRASIYFDLLICELLDYAQQKNHASDMEKVKDIIHRHPEHFFSNQELAEQVGISLKGLETKFKTQFGITIHRYMLQFKIQQAQRDLMNFQEMSIREIAHNLGFYDEYHFSNQFKRLTGISPQQYRREHRVTNQYDE